MSQDFDPYYTWLGIPPAEQPANHYRLLGVRDFEENLDVIQNAADQRMAYIRTFQSGKRASISQKILNEIATSQAVLYSAEKRAAYDTKLRATQAQAASAKVETPLAPPVTPLPPQPRASHGPAVPMQGPGAGSRGLGATEESPLDGPPPQSYPPPGFNAPPVGAAKQPPNFAPPPSRDRTLMYVIIGILSMCALCVVAMIAAPIWLLTRNSESEASVERPSRPNYQSSPRRPRNPIPSRPSIPQPRPAPAPSIPKPNQPGNSSDTGDSYAVRLGNNDAVTIRPGRIRPIADNLDECTLDTWLRVEKLQECMLALVTAPPTQRPDAGTIMEWQIIAAQKSDGVEISLMVNRYRESPQKVAFPRRAKLGDDFHHLAVSRNQERFSAWCDGVSLGQIVTDTPTESAGSVRTTNFAAGLRSSKGFNEVDFAAIRLSSGVLFTGEFTPPWPLQVTQFTLIMPRIDDSIRRQLVDLSNTPQNLWKQGSFELVKFNAPRPTGPIHASVLPLSPGASTVVTTGSSSPATTRTPSTPATPSTPSTPTSTAPPASTTPPDAKIAMPTAESIATAKAEVDRVFTDILRRATSPDQKKLLAQTLSTTAEKETDPAKRYVLLSQAIQVAVTAGDLHGGAQLVEQLVEDYEVDGAQEKLKFAQAIVRQGLAPPERAQAALMAAEFSQTALDEQDFSAAAELANLSYRMAQNAGSTDLRAAMMRHMRKMEQIKTEHTRYQQALTHLADVDPDTPQEHLVAGQFLATAIEDWEAACKHFAKCDKPAIRDAALGEQKNPTDAGEQLSIADAWRDAAKDETAHKKFAYLRRARHWYEQAATQPGLSRTAAEREIASIDAILPASERVSSFASTGVLEPGLVGRYYLNGQLTPALLKVHNGETIRGRDISPQGGFPTVKFELNGVIKLEEDATVRIHGILGAIGNGSAMRVLIDGKEVFASGQGVPSPGQPQVDLTAGEHRVTWQLQGATFNFASLSFSERNAGGDKWLNDDRARRSASTKPYQTTIELGSP